MALHLSAEYREGLLAGVRNFIDPDRTPENPYDCFNAYTRHYAWDVGFQVARSRIRECRLTPQEVRRAWEEKEEAVFRLLKMEGEDLPRQAEIPSPSGETRRG